MSANAKTGGGRGFALVAALLGLVLILGLALAMMSLAAVVIRVRDVREHEQRAQANARLAMTMAAGQLQLALGPDTRVSAPSGLPDGAVGKYWTGVWNAHAPDGRPWVRRDVETGGLYDIRTRDGYDRDREVMEWLVSGAAAPGDSMEGMVRLVGPGSVAAVEDEVFVPAIRVSTAGGDGKIAWWTGDLGQRANPVVDGIWMGEAEADVAMEERKKSFSDASLALAGFGQDWAKRHFHDYSVHSRGVLADVREGGMKRNLTDYFSQEDRGGIRELDHLVGPMNAEEAEIDGLAWERNPWRRSSPRLGAVLDWIKPGAVAGQPISASLSAAAEMQGLRPVSANASPARIERLDRAVLQPILVEASQLHSFSWFRKETGDANNHFLRKHLYPRVTFWNPYPVPLSCPAMLVMIQVNGRHDFWLEGFFPGKDGKAGSAVLSPWLAFDGGRSRDFLSGGGSIFNSPAYLDPHMGSYYYHVPETTYLPGECLMFTPERDMAYSTGVREDAGGGDLTSNRLTPGLKPDAGRAFTLSQPDQLPGFGFVPTGMVMESTASFFQMFKMIGPGDILDDLRVVVKCAVGKSEVDVDAFDALPQITFISGSFQYGEGREKIGDWPGDKRIPIVETTDDAARAEPDARTWQGLRLRSPKDGTEAAFANWNPRAAYLIRCPWDTFHEQDTQGGPARSGSFGIYRSVSRNGSWGDEFPTAFGGRARVDPVGSGKFSNVVLEAPPVMDAMDSLGVLQHAPISVLGWHPAKAVGNSLADPRVGQTGTLPGARGKSGFIERHIGQGGAAWAQAGCDILLGLPEGQAALVYDFSYEANHNLWDRFYLSGEAGETEVDGMFNVNSLSVPAWASVLGAMRDEKAWPRKLSNAEVVRLAEALVGEVRNRGPFLSMSDFVNRRLEDGESGRMGALEAAIEAAGLNQRTHETYPRKHPGTSLATGVDEPLLKRSEVKPQTTAWGMDGHVTQGDVLRAVGGRLAARSDTFLIRAYGESMDNYGNVRSRARCEAVFQRSGTVVEGSDAEIGRPFRMVGFRWLASGEL